MLMGNLKNLGFEFRNCSAMYELDLNEDVNKYRCKACDLEFCPVIYLYFIKMIKNFIYNIS